MPSILSKLAKKKFHMTDRQLTHKLTFSRQKHGPRVSSLYELRERKHWGLHTVMSENVGIPQAAVFPASEVALDCVKAALEDPTIKLDSELFDAIDKHARYGTESWLPAAKVIPILEKLYDEKCQIEVCLGQKRGSKTN